MSVIKLYFEFIHLISHMDEFLFVAKFLCGLAVHLGQQKSKQHFGPHSRCVFGLVVVGV